MSDSKIMLVGSTVTDVMSVTAPDPKVLKEEEKAAAAASGSKEPISRQKVLCTFHLSLDKVLITHLHVNVFKSDSILNLCVV